MIMITLKETAHFSHFFSPPKLSFLLFFNPHVPEWSDLNINNFGIIVNAIIGYEPIIVA